jgi:hypothetical protein
VPTVKKPVNKKIKRMTLLLKFKFNDLINKIIASRENIEKKNCEKKIKLNFSFQSIKVINKL